MQAKIKSLKGAGTGGSSKGVAKGRDVEGEGEWHSLICTSGPPLALEKGHLQ